MRAKQHARSYSRTFGVSVSLSLFAVVDAAYLSHAERRVRDHFAAHRVQYEQQTELVVLSSSELALARKMFGQVQVQCMSRYRALTSEVETLTAQLAQSRIETVQAAWERDCKARDIEMVISAHKKDVAMLEMETRVLERDVRVLTAKHAAELLSRDIEIMNLTRSSVGGSTNSPRPDSSRRHPSPPKSDAESVHKQN
jgi:hypothetical protein